MPVHKLALPDFLALARQCPVLDVRSPGEYSHAHMPGAHSLPLFTDEERKIVGTAYKQESRKRAIRIGLDFFGKKMVRLVEEVEGLLAGLTSRGMEDMPNGSGNAVLVHCWRGGMRSAGVAWLLDLYGFTVYTLTGGYKAYRNWVLHQFTRDYTINVVGGYTGSGKTHLLQQLARRGEAVIDLEGLAAHKGSSFGNLEGKAQPSQEMFENELATRLVSLSNQASTTLWMEDESQRIGLVNIPGALLQTMHRQRLFFLDIPFEERLNHLVIEYGNADRQQVADAILRIDKRLGGLETKKAIQFLEENNIQDCFRILLTYYDKYYMKAINKVAATQPIIKLITATVDTEKNTSLLLQQQTQLV